MIESRLFRGHEWYLDGKSAWYVLIDAPGICKVDLDSKRIQEIIQIPHSICKGVFSCYFSCFRKNKYIYCLPDLSDNVIRYDLEEKSFDSVSLEGSGRVLGYVIKDSYLFFYTSMNKKMIKMNLDTFKIVDIYEYHSINEDNNYLLNVACNKEGIWCATGEMNKLVLFDCKKDSFESFEIEGEFEDIITGVELVDNHFFLTGLENVVYHCILNDVDNRLRMLDKIKLADTDLKLVNEIQTLNDYVINNRKVWIISRSCNYLTIFDIDERKTDYFYFEEEKKTWSKMRNDIYLELVFKTDTSKLAIRNNDTSKFYEIDTNNNIMQSFNLQFEVDDIKNAYSNIVYREEFMNLNEFFSII